MTCDVQSLSTAAGQFNPLTKHEKRAALVLYLYRQKNTGTVGTAVPAASLLASAECIACNITGGPDSSMLDAFELAIQRQAAVDAGAAEPAANFNTVRSLIVGLTALSDTQLRSIELWLRCQIA